MMVLLTTPSPENVGGVAHYYQVLQPHFGSDVEYLTVGARNPRERAFGRCRRLVRDYLHFYHRLRSGSHDLVHLNPSLGPKALVRDGLFLLIAKFLGRRVLVFLRGWDPACEASIRRWFLPLFRQVYFQADAFIVLASQFQSALREFGYDKPIYLETTVVSDEVFGCADTPPACKSPSDHLNILFLSRVEKAKGIYEAIEAFRILRAKHPGVVLTVAGDGSELDSVREYVRSRQMEGVAFLGRVRGPSKAEVFANADIYLFPTHHGEGMPNSVLEAMAFGLPVITRPVGGVRDFFEDGRMGFLTDSREPHVFAALLEELIADAQLRSRMGDYNRTYALNRFRASRVVQRLDLIYRAVAQVPQREPSTNVWAEVATSEKPRERGRQ